jgi:hypothetical protein
MMDGGRALEKIRAGTAAMFYTVWSIIGIAIIALAVLFAADPPDWSVEPTPVFSTTTDPDGMGYPDEGD